MLQDVFRRFFGFIIDIVTDEHIVDAARLLITNLLIFFLIYGFFFILEIFPLPIPEPFPRVFEYIKILFIFSVVLILTISDFIVFIKNYIRKALDIFNPRTIYNFDSPAFIVSTDFQIKAINDAALELLQKNKGLPTKMIINSDCRRLHPGNTHPKKCPCCIEHISITQEGVSVTTGPEEVDFKCGKFRLMGNPIFDYNNNIVGLFHVAERI